MPDIETLKPAEAVDTESAAGKEIKQNSSEPTDQDRLDLERAEGEGMIARSFPPIVRLTPKQKLHTTRIENSKE